RRSCCRNRRRNSLTFPRSPLAGSGGSRSLSVPRAMRRLPPWVHRLDRGTPPIGMLTEGPFFGREKKKKSESDSGQGKRSRRLPGDGGKRAGRADKDAPCRPGRLGGPFPSFGVGPHLGYGFARTVIRVGALWPFLSGS